MTKRISTGRPYGTFKICYIANGLLVISMKLAGSKKRMLLQLTGDNAKAPYRSCHLTDLPKSAADVLEKSYRNLLRGTK